MNDGCHNTEGSAPTLTTTAQMRAEFYSHRNWVTLILVKFFQFKLDRGWHYEQVIKPFLMFLSHVD